ncbi:hypothetical protein ACQ5SO_06210 [Rhodovulum sp. DZ06]|uniref:hypothetical protein n=1 Tax=Rhodovulum sp. DZ06 TaxID=3425126 RepID=UPI003D348ECD
MKTARTAALAAGMALLGAASAQAATASDPAFYIGLETGTSHALAGFTLSGVLPGPASLHLRFGQWSGDPDALTMSVAFNGTVLPSFESTGAYYSQPASIDLDVGALVVNGLNTLSISATGQLTSPPTFTVGEIALSYTAAVSDVPLPGGAALMLGALAALGAARRRAA